MVSSKFLHQIQRPFISDNLILILMFIILLLIIIFIMMTTMTRRWCFWQWSLGGCRQGGVRLRVAQQVVIIIIIINIIMLRMWVMMS